MKRNINILLGLISITLLTIGCAPKTNPYMVKTTPDFQKVTNHFVGDWAFTKYDKAGKDLLADPFEKGSVSFDFDTRKTKYSFWVSESKLAEKLVEWQQQFPGLKVSEYKVVVTTGWKVKESGKVLDTGSAENHQIVIKGSGNNFASFYDWERSRFEAGKNIGKSKGGLMGMAMSAVAKQATGTSDLFVSVADNYTFEFSNGNQDLSLCRKGAIYKENLTDCKERASLKKK